MHPYAASRERGSTCWAKSLQLKPRQRAATASKSLALLLGVQQQTTFVQTTRPASRTRLQTNALQALHIASAALQQNAIDAR
jgi:hypothetical protein